MVIGERPADVDIRRVVSPRFAVAAAGPAWLSLLNPDGIALLDAGLELTGVACFIENIAGQRASGLGTRHTALARATQGRRNVGIAMSDDGGPALTSFESFRAFQKDIRERCAEPPQPAAPVIVGNYGMLA